MRESAVQKVEILLQNIKTQKQTLDNLQAQFMQEVEKIQTKYVKPIEDAKNKIKLLELELEKTAKANKQELFSTSDILKTRFGRVILTIKEAVKRAKGVLEKLEQLGWNEAIIVEKKVKWDELKKWPDKKLVECGTKKIKKEVVIYEIGELK